MTESVQSTEHVELPRTVTIDNFRRVKLIGKGDVGRVYLCQLKGTNNYFAMKVLIKDEMLQRNKVSHVTTEKDILLTTRHPFLVHLYWSFATTSCFYFIMDFCQGGDMYFTLQHSPGKCLPEETSKFYLAEVVLALEYLHLNQIIYRDLKPENILFTSTGHIMLSDFDLSKAKNRQHNTTGISEEYKKAVTEPSFVTNSFVGTEEYLAPEVISGYGHSGSVDWWTLGILTYEMLFGKTPFVSRCRAQTFSLILDGEVQFPKTSKYPISTAARDFIKKLLVIEPSRRLGTKNGAEEIKSQKFFKNVKFQLIRNMTAPLVQKFSGPEDTSKFRDIKDDGVIDRLEEKCKDSSAKEGNKQE